MNAFGSNVERHRRELLVHCYRMLGSSRRCANPVAGELLFRPFSSGSQTQCNIVTLRSKVATRSNRQGQVAVTVGTRRNLSGFLTYQGLSGELKLLPCRPVPSSGPH